MPCVLLWEGKLEVVFLTIPLRLTYFLSWLHWAWDRCRWNKYSIRLNCIPVNMALSNALKEMPTTYWTALGAKLSLRAVVPPSQPSLEAGAPTSQGIRLARLTVGLLSEVLCCWSYTQASSLELEKDQTRVSHEVFTVAGDYGPPPREEKLVFFTLFPGQSVGLETATSLRALNSSSSQIIVWSFRQLNAVMGSGSGEGEGGYHYHPSAEDRHLVAFIY